MATLETRRTTGRERGARPVSLAPETSPHDVDARPVALPRQIARDPGATD